jgi:hypothetical protein
MLLGAWPALAQSEAARYAIEYRPVPGNDLAWKLDTATGQMWTCASSMQRCQPVPNSLAAADGRIAGRYRFSAQGSQAWRIDGASGRVANCMTSGCGPEKPE